MAKYICKRCGYEASQKQNYINHLHRKNVCEIVYESISIEQLKLEIGIEIPKSTIFNTQHTQNELLSNNDKPFCADCNKSFSQWSSLYRHKRKSCKKICEVSSDNIINALQEEIQHLKKENKKIVKQIRNP